MFNKVKNFLNLGPAHIITFSFLAIILIGATLLVLPISSQDGQSIGALNALFTATSAVCVTGLVVVNTLTHWTIFGKIVILILIQVGALGFMSLFTLVLIVLGRKITLRERILIQESFNLSTFKGIVKFLKTIIAGTFIIESIGAVILSIKFIPVYGFLNGIFKGIFHSISAFCNAGFDILGPVSLMDYSSDYTVNITIMILVIIGGLGFSVWLDLAQYLKHKIKVLKDEKVSRLNMTLHTKLTLVITLVLIVSGAIGIFVLEYTNKDTLQGLRFDHKILSSLFQSITLRTAGFDAIGQGALNDGSKFFSILLMAIGGSPGGTAGGIKTVTVGALVLAVLAVIKGKDQITAFKKHISFNTVQKALAVILMMLSLIFVATIVLCMTEKNTLQDFSFIDILFEVTSALATVGLSTGVTDNLSAVGRIIIIICMFVGRLGPITVALALSFKKRSKVNSIHYPEEKILVG